jgi:DivIVA domain-containing protein
MTWFFAILVVALMGGVAVVAVGGGGSMAETYDDRPDSRVPADGPLGSADLRAVRFSTAFRGYRMSEVDALLDRLAAELEPEPARAALEPRVESSEEPVQGPAPGSLPGPGDPRDADGSGPDDRGVPDGRGRPQQEA